MKKNMYLASERKEYILSRLSDKGSARTISLSKEMNVTDETVRNDLIILEKSGLLRRVHGGAISLKKKALNESLLVHTDIDVSIAKSAMMRVKPNSSVFIDGGAIGHLVASYLPSEPIAIITNSPTIVSRLENNTTAEVYCTGGLLDRKTGLLIGKGAADSIKNIGIDLFILIPDTYSPIRGLGFDSLAHAEFTQEILEHAKNVCVLCPVAQLTASATYYISSSKVTDMITNETASDELLEDIIKAGVHVDRV
ncbi:MAG: DeoR/GlpR family DNA-binding transcription regulator [Akkermansia sp.]